MARNYTSATLYFFDFGSVLRSSQERMKRVAIACGGTGGHLCPGIAIAEELKENGIDPVLVISRKPIDNVIAARYDQFEYLVTRALPFSKKPGKFLLFIWSQLISICSCIKFLWKKDIDCVIGTGGFTNLALVVSAFLMRKKIVLHELNQVIGKSIKVLAPFADVVFLPSGVSFSKNSLQKKVIHASVPLRSEIKKVPKAKARAKIGIPSEAKLITILGGSQGANSLNKWALNNLDKLNRAGVSVCCVCGPKNFMKFKKFGTRGNLQNLFLPFCDSMSELLCSTDLLVCRAGAGTIAEAMRLGVPMILVPYPYAAENHQEFNAIYARKLGCAAVVHESEINKLTDKVLEIFKSDFLGFAKRRSYRNSNKAIVDVIKKLIGIKNV